MTADQIYRFMQNPDKMNQETLQALKELTEQYPAFETGWILYLKNLKILKDSSFEQELINGAIRIHDRRKLYLFLNQKAGEAMQEQSELTESIAADAPDVLNLIFPTEYRLDTPVKTEETVGEIARSIQNKPDKKQTLIEKFLEAQPKMPQVKDQESESPMEGQKQKELENDDFVTETLATIYAQQGYYKKAIQIFEKLSLKYPEKSTYFAAQIEKIKTLMNN
jgi:tetratricopeptide (TPR) repeat protein